MEKSSAEKTIFPEITQVGIVVRDMRKAIEYYESLGIGPFKPSGKPPIAATILRGQSVDAKHETRFAQLGKIQLELLQPLEGESSAKEFLETRGEGIQHLGFHVDDIEQELSKLSRIGVKVLQRGRRAGDGYALLDTDAIGGVVLELIQRPSL